jgi:hypothetical protein
MRRHLRARTLRLLLTCVMAAASYGAMVEPAGAADQLVMQATQRLRLKGCGKQRDQIDAVLRVEDSPAWNLDLGAPPSGGSSLAGSYTTSGRRDRKVALQTDVAGVTTLTARIGALATVLCGSDTGADGIEVKAFKLTRGKKAAGFKLTAKFTATTGKRGKLAVRGKGVLEPAPTTSTTTPASTTSTSIVGSSSTTFPSTTTVTSTTVKTTTTVTATTMKTTTTTVTSTTAPTSSTTVTSTSSTTTTTTFNECQGVADGVFCSEDGNLCSKDLCIGGVCTHTTPQPFGWFCREANGSPCDANDGCNGLSCPDQKSTSLCPGPVPAELPCHQPGFLFCNGQSDECPAESLCVVGDVCNADDQCATGACVQGTCAELGPACAPCDSAADCASPLVCTDSVCTDPTASPCCDVNDGGALLPAGTPCRPATDLCDVAETCTGASPSCPPDALLPADTFCRSATAFQGCDLADYCTGDSAVCPDIVRPAGYVCGPSAGPCDEIQETCNGVSKPCPLNVFSQYCQPSQGPCDVVDSCAPGDNPNYPECPADTVEPFGTVCEPPPGSPMTDCQEYICDGSGYACDQIRNRGSSYPCRPAVDECDVADLCGVGGPPSAPNYNPNFPNCPTTDLHQPDGTPCTTTIGGFDGTCQGGTCVESLCKYDIDCADGEVCDTATWHCVAKVGAGQGAACTGVGGSIVGTCSGLICCADMEGDGVGSYAGAGQPGRCAQCCGNQQSTIDDCQLPELECCDGRCINVGTSEEHCGGCTPGSNASFGTGHDCSELENGCYRNATGCEFGVCVFESECTNGDYCSLSSEPCSDGIFCYAGFLMDTLCTSNPPDFPGCEYTCAPNSLLDELMVTSSCLNFGCESDTDCCNGLVCRSTCSTRDYGFCFGSRTCQVP